MSLFEALDSWRPTQLVGWLAGRYTDAGRARAERLSAFRRKLAVELGRVHDTADEGLTEYYAQARRQVLDSCAEIEEDIPKPYKQKFCTALEDYRCVEQTITERGGGRLMFGMEHGTTVLPPQPLDPRTRRQIIVEALKVMRQFAHSPL